MDRISELLDRVQQSENVRMVGGRGDSTVYYRWMVEATNRIQELEETVRIQGLSIDLLLDNRTEPS